MRKDKLLLPALLLIAGLHSLYYYPKLPPLLASHFDGAGNPDKWSGKTEFFFLYVLILVMLCLIFYAATLVRRINNRWIKIPYKQYWLAAERRGHTLEYIDKRFRWLSLASIAFAISIIHFTLLANLNETVKLDNEFIRLLLVGYLIYITAWVLQFIRRFFKIKTPRRRY